MSNDLDFAVGIKLVGQQQTEAGLGLLGKKFKTLTGVLGKTHATLGDIKSYQKLNKAMSANGMAIKKTRDSLSSLGKKIKATTSPSAKLTNAYNKNKQALGGLLNKQKQEKSSLKTLSVALKKARVNTRDLKNENKKYGDSISKTALKLKKYSSRHNVIQQQKDRSLQRAANANFIGNGMMTAGRGVLNTVRTPFERMKAVEKSKGELRSLNLSKEEVNLISKKGQETSSVVAGSSTADFNVGAYAIKSAVASLSAESVADVTSSATIVAKATKSNVDTMSQLFGKGYGIYKKNLHADMDDSKFGEKFGAMVVSAVQNFATDGNKMGAAIASAGESASKAGISAEEQFAVLGQAQSSIGSAQAGTSYMALYRNVAGVQEKLKKQGISVKLLKKDGNAKGLPAMLEELENVFGKTLETTEQGMLSKAFGDEAMKMLLNAWGTGSEITKMAQKIKKESDQGVKYSKKVLDNMQDNFSDRWDIQKQKWQVIQEKIGNALIPIIEKLMPHLETFANWLSKWISENEGLTAVIAGTAVAVGGFLGLGGGLMIALGSLAGSAAYASASLRMLGAGRGLGGPGVMPGGGGKGGKGSKIGKFGKAGGIATAGLAAYGLYNTWTDDKKTSGEKLDDTTETAMGLGGMWAGAKLGAAGGALIGSAVPVLGTAVGAAVGGVVGSIGGYFAGSSAGDWLGDFWKNDDKKNQSPKNQDNSFWRVHRGTDKPKNQQVQPLLAQVAPITKPVPQKTNIAYNYGGVNVKVVNPASEIDIQRAVKRSLKDIKRDDFNRSYDEDVSP